MSSQSEKGSIGFPAEYHWAGYLLGFAIGGFFDGILLHQVLQWHHLLSGLQGGRFGDLRFQILSDGLFHLMMYLMALAGLFLLWWSRGVFARPNADRLIIADALIGFGAWHMLDGVVSHWLLGIHRIRMDSGIPLFWDLSWFLLFGVAFVAAGLFLRSRGGSGDGVRAGPAALTLLALVMGGGAALPPPRDAELLVVFRPGLSPADALSAVARVEGRLVWTDPSDQVWAIVLPEQARLLDLYRNGALLVSGSPVVAGCLNWVRR
ncbi:DUF2243 domain-containing protein [Chelativorans sp. AA-79]|uniref:DUF2243 domain-containing protein n=1 Tax=Chelativorans sp. AA-79 TaxID=3028735 RepID=UPI0023F84E41|nr:DUF2243 domain-containing protein [Chelativorans sp. AA-79]WEX09127.1 DUF2243 domain-containing protein [Chelativorans sp. AA-79]